MIPLFGKTLPALAESVNRTAGALRKIRDSSGPLPWTVAHLIRETEMRRAQAATQAVLYQMVELENGMPRIVDGNFVPIPENVAVVTKMLADYPGTPADGIALLTQFGVVDAAAKVFNTFYIGWHDALPISAFRGWDTSGGSLTRIEVHALTEEQARPLRESAELSALIEAFEAVGG